MSPFELFSVLFLTVPIILATKVKVMVMYLRLGKFINLFWILL